MEVLDKHRMWPISVASILNENENRVANFVTGFMYCIPKSVLRPGSCSFNEFPENTVDGDNWSMLTAFVWQLVHKIHTKSQGRQREQVAGSTQPDIQTFLECVEAEESKDGTRKNRTVYMHPAFRDSEDSKQLNDAVDGFLPNVPNVDIVEYRLWVFIYTDKINLVDIVCSMIKECEERTNKKTGDIEGNKRGSRKTASATSEDDESCNLNTYKKWKKIEGLDHAIGLFEFYRGCTYFKYDNSVELAICDNGKPKNDKTKHALNPATTFQLTDCAQFPNESACVAQRLCNSYFVQEGSRIEIVFPKPENVLKVSPSIFRPASVYNKYLPDFQKCMVVRDAFDKNAVYHHLPRHQSSELETERWNALKKDLGTLNCYTSATHEDLPEVDPELQQSERLKLRSMGGIADKYYQMSELHKLKAIADLDMAAINRMATMEERRSELRALQDWLFDQFKYNVMHTDANIGIIGRAIMKGVENEDLWNFCPTLPICDENMSVFANMVANWMLVFEKYLFVVNAHKHLLFVLQGRLDAYKHSFDIHLAMLMIGKSNTSKSYVLKLTIKLSIEDTVDNLMYTTTKSDAIDGNRNDVITVMEEAPVSNFAKDAKDVMQQNLFKNKVTSYRTRVKTIVMNEDGSRTNRITNSECISTWFGATNEYIRMDESMMSRFHFAYFTETHRQGHEVETLQNVSQRLLGRDTQEINHYYKWFHKIQAQNWLVQKLMMTRGLQHVTTECTHTATCEILNYIKKKCSFNVHGRISQRMSLMAEQFTISTALYSLFYAKGIKVPDIDNPQKLVPNFCGKPFELDQLKYIDSILRDTEEIANFVMLLMEDQIVSPAEYKLIEFFKDATRSVDIKCRFRSPEMKINEKGSTAAYSFSENKNKARKDGITEPDSVPAYADSSSDDDEEEDEAAFVKESDDDDDSAEKKNERIDCTYCMVPYSYYGIETAVYNYFADENIKNCVQEIRYARNMLFNRTIKSHAYTYDPKEDTMFEDSSTPIENRSCILRIKGMQYIYVHACLLTASMNSGDSIVMEAIKTRLTHKYTIPGWKMLSGEIYDPGQQPHLFKTYSLTPKPDTIYKFTNQLYMDKLSHSALIHVDDMTYVSDVTARCQKYTSFMMDNSSHSCMVRMSILNFPIYRENWQEMCQSIHPVMEICMLKKALSKNDKSPIKSYPTSYTIDYASQVKEMEDETVSVASIPADCRNTAILKSAPSMNTVMNKLLEKEFNVRKRMFEKYCPVSDSGEKIKLPFLQDEADESMTIDSTAQDEEESHPQPTKRRKFFPPPTSSFFSF